jgi:hypothetical protein
MTFYEWQVQAETKRARYSASRFHHSTFTIAASASPEIVVTPGDTSIDRSQLSSEDLASSPSHDMHAVQRNPTPDRFIPPRASTPVFDADSSHDACALLAHPGDISFPCDLDDSGDDDDKLSSAEREKDSALLYSASGKSSLTVGQHKARMLQIAAEARLTDRQLSILAKYMGEELLPMNNRCPSSLYMYKKSENRLFHKYAKVVNTGTKDAE